MKITRASDYAIRALTYMSTKPKGTTFMRSDLSKITEVPDSFLGKILQNLARSDILISERGKNGGFKLEKDPGNISVYDIINAVEGEITITECLADDDYCGRMGLCKTHKMWHDIQTDLTDKLSSTKLSDLI